MLLGGLFHCWCSRSKYAARRVPDGADRVRGEALWHERLPLYDMGDGSWVVLTPDEDMFVEDLSRADSLRICGPNRELPRGIGNGQSYRFSGAWYTLDELEVLREEAKLLATVKPAGTAVSEMPEVMRRRVPAGAGVLVPDESAGPVDTVIDETENNAGRGRTLSRCDDDSEWVIISGGEFFGRTVKAGRSELNLRSWRWRIWVSRWLRASV